MQDCFIFFILPFAILPLCWISPPQCNAYRIHKKPSHDTAPRSPSIYSNSQTQQFSRQAEPEVQPRLPDASRTITDSEIGSDKSAIGDNQSSNLNTQELSQIENLLRNEETVNDKDLEEDDNYNPDPEVIKRDFSRDRKWYHFTMDEFQQMMNFLNRQPSGRGNKVFSRARMVG